MKPGRQCEGCGAECQCYDTGVEQCNDCYTLQGCPQPEHIQCRDCQYCIMGDTGPEGIGWCSLEQVWVLQ